MKYHEFDNLRKYRLAKEKGYTTLDALVDELAAHGFEVTYAATEGDLGGLRVIARG